ncbi:MAG: sensor histidine kinase [Polaromonas sp.]
MIHSFRLRLALLSALMSGLALIAFGIGSWWVIHEFKMDRLDQDVRSNAEREVGRIFSIGDWERIRPALVSSLGLRDDVDLIFLTQDQDGRERYRSPNWPAGLNASALPWPMHRSVELNERVARGGPPGPFPTDSVPTGGSNAPQLPSPVPEVERKLPGFPPTSAGTSRSVSGQQWRIGLATTDRARVAIGVNARFVADDMKNVRNAFFLALPLAIFFIGLGSWFLSSRALQPLDKLISTTRGISVQKLNQRIPPQGEDREFAELIEVFNGMLERLERSFNQAHRFSADAAHELKTPLAILQGQFERAIGKVDAGSITQIELSSFLDEVRRLSTISRKLLLLSQADAGRLNVHREPFDLTSALVDLVEDIHMLAGHLQLTQEIDPGLIVQADGSLLRQVLHNLISNAIKYNVEKGWIQIATTISPGWVEVNVVNSSPGIPVAAQGRIFERFFRADSSHSRQIEGVGLGLSVSREIARAHGGDITFSAQAGVVRFVLRLPV